MQALVPLRPGAAYPDDRVIDSIDRCDPGRAAAGLSLAPGKYNHGRICWGNSVGPDRVRFIMKSKIRRLPGMVRDR